MAFGLSARLAVRHRSALLGLSSVEVGPRWAVSARQGNSVKVIFLDFDGVVVCLPVEWDRLENGRGVHALNRAAVARLNDLVERTGAGVVVSSSWRLHQSVEHLTGYLRRAGFRGQVLDKTPDRHAWGAEEWQRGDEIMAWLKLNPQVTSYVALDDDFDHGAFPADRWVLVKDGWFAGGIQDEHVEAATAALERAA